MVRVADCHAGVLGWNPGGPKGFFPGITSTLPRFDKLGLRKQLTTAVSVINLDGAPCGRNHEIC